VRRMGGGKTEKEKRLRGEEGGGGALPGNGRKDKKDGMARRHEIGQERKLVNRKGKEKKERNRSAWTSGILKKSIKRGKQPQQALEVRKESI